MSHATAWCILHETLLYPYYFVKVQAFQPTDAFARVRFGEWLFQRNDQNAYFTADILATDEVIFTHNSITNLHNTHIWSFGNPHAVVLDHFQHPFSLNCGQVLLISLLNHSYCPIGWMVINSWNFFILMPNRNNKFRWVLIKFTER